jgi:hypothetical protein
MNHFGYNAKSTLIVCPKIPLVLKEKFISCKNIVPARMSIVELWGTGGSPGSARAAISSQSKLRKTWRVVPRHPSMFPSRSHHNQKVNIVGLHQIS